MIVSDQNPIPENADTPAAQAETGDAFAAQAETGDAFAEVPAEPEEHVAGEPAPAAAGIPPQYGVGPFSIREVALLGVWLLAFIVSFFSLYVESQLSVFFGAGASVWSAGIDWILTIGVPTAAVFLIALRRFSPDGIRRVGSLGIDQFASVAFSVSAVLWLGMLWTNIARAVQTGLWLGSWVIWVEAVLMLAGVFLTVFAPFIAPFHEDFQHRAEVPAHRAARGARPVVARPAAERPVAAFAPAAPAYGAPESAPAYGEAPSGAAPYSEPAAPAYGESAYGEPVAQSEPVAQVADGQPAHGEPAAFEPGYDDAAPLDGPAAFEPGYDGAAPLDGPADLDPFAPVDETAVTDEPAPAPQAFWALAPVERDVVDESGAPLFRIGPTAWALVIEDRGDSFVVRHEDGRVGYLTDISGVTRG